jgi:hypothetical protein
LDNGVKTIKDFKELGTAYINSNEESNRGNKEFPEGG